MEFLHITLHVLAFLSVVVVGSHASLSPKDYWELVLPHTPMPKSIQDLLQSKGLSHLDAVTPSCTGIHVGFDKFSEPAGADGAAASSKFGNFFLETGLRPGQKMELHLSTPTNGAVFLPRQVSDSFPFSSDKLPEILNRFSIPENSAEAEIVKKEIQGCEAPAMKGESRYCATSLESLIDFSSSNLGRNVKLMANGEKSGNQVYEFGAGIRKVGDRSVVCHQLNYPYAVFSCHTFSKTRTYVVPLVGGDGSKVKAMAACHTDTSGWHPKHAAFKVLNVKPGTVPVCHFLHNNAIAWVPN